MKRAGVLYLSCNNLEIFSYLCRGRVFCIYSVTIQKSILMKRAVVLYLFCNNLEMNSYHREGRYFVSIL